MTTTNATAPMRTGRHDGLMKRRSESPMARAPRVRGVRSNWRRFQRLRAACSRRCSTGMTFTGAPSHCSAVAAAAGAALHRVVGGGGFGSSARARPPATRIVATPSVCAQVRVTAAGAPGAPPGATSKWPTGGSSGQTIGTTRSTKTRARCNAAISVRSHERSTAATQVAWPATASGASAR
jgi:hypothetical protein